MGRRFLSPHFWKYPPPINEYPPIYKFFPSLPLLTNIWTFYRFSALKNLLYNISVSEVLIKDNTLYISLVLNINMPRRESFEKLRFLDVLRANFCKSGAVCDSDHLEISWF